MNLLIIAILVSAGFYIYFDFKKNQTLRYITKPLTTILIIVLAFLQQTEGFDSYGYLIIAGLIFSLFGDIFLMLPTDKFIQGLAAFFVAHIFYIIAFSSGFGPYFEIGYLIPAIIYAVIFLWVILPKTGSMKLPVLIYTLVLLVFMWQATGRYYYLAETSALYVFVGAILFVISDSILAYARFVKNFRISQLIILSTYWGAQLCFALSI